MPTADPTPRPPATGTTTTTDATCLACGCLCDDIAVTVAGGRVVAAERACALGLPSFLEPHPGSGGPAATVDGRPVATGAALDRAAALLGAARSPVIWGLTRSSIEAVGAALALADRLGATVDLAGSSGRAARRAAFVRVGAVTATLGEVKDRAGVVLFWGGHPDATHPRHGGRYSIARPGRFVPGRRTVAVVDVGDGPIAGEADVRVALAADRQEAALGVLLALAQGVALDPARVETATGHPLATWRGLIDLLRGVPVGAIGFGPGAGSLGATGWDRAWGLVRALNADRRRCLGFDLGEPGNAAGAAAVLTWQAGAPGWLDFGGIGPRHLPGEATLADRLATGAVDAVLAVGLDPADHLDPAGVARLVAVPRVVIAPDACRPGPAVAPPPASAIAVGRLGIEAGGTVARVDGAMLPLRPALAGPIPDDRTILRDLLTRLG